MTQSGSSALTSAVALVTGGSRGIGLAISRRLAAAGYHVIAVARRENDELQAAIDEAVPAPVLTTALYERFSSRGEADFQNKLLSAMRYEFGGHLEKS